MPKIVITGGPCTGKTTLLNDLGKLGFNTVHEASRKIIDEEQKKENGVLPWTDAEQFEVLVKQMQMGNETNLTSETIHFLDRGLGDILAYCDFLNIPHTEGVKQLSLPPRYEKVLLLEPLEIFENDDVRKESLEEGRKIHEFIEKAYTGLGYEVVKVPPLGKKERLDWVLKQLNLVKQS
ncbi:MAG: ATP-binding protein [Candidatus Aenigmarchaeota archaeon]|nr:ATP-binding protein [Candidatus Aenigmarchaeota archaeon]